jgi:hypothetical protein
MCSLNRSFEADAGTSVNSVLTAMVRLVGRLDVFSRPFSEKYASATVSETSWCRVVKSGGRSEEGF